MFVQLAYFLMGGLDLTIPDVAQQRLWPSERVVLHFIGAGYYDYYGRLWLLQGAAFFGNRLFFSNY